MMLLWGNAQSIGVEMQIDSGPAPPLLLLLVTYLLRDQVRLRDVVLMLVDLLLMLHF